LNVLFNNFKNYENGMLDMALTKNIYFLNLYILFSKVRRDGVTTINEEHSIGF